MDYYQKYLKYKFKYIKFKSQYGGKCELKTGYFFSKKDRPICQILVDKDCVDRDVTLTLDHKEDMLRNCKPKIAVLERWYGKDKKKVVDFDILGFKEKKKLLYTTKDYIDAEYTIEDVLESLLLIYANNPDIYDELYDEVIGLIEGLPFTLKDYKNLMLFIKTLINKNKIDKNLTDEKYKKLMSAIKKKLTDSKSKIDDNHEELMLAINEKRSALSKSKFNYTKYKELMLSIKKTLTKRDEQLMSPIERGIIQALFTDSPRNISLIYDEIEKELFFIDFTFLNEEILDYITKIPDTFMLIKEKFELLSIQQIKDFFCFILLANCKFYCIEFFKKHLSYRIVTEDDINSLLLNPTDPKNEEYYNNFFSYFPEIALEFSEKLDIDYIISNVRSELYSIRSVVVQILLNKLAKLLEQKKYVECYELLRKSETILNKVQKQSFFKSIKDKNHSEEYMNAILLKFITDSNPDINSDINSDIKTQLSKLMITAFYFGFNITPAVQNNIDNLKKKLVLSEGDFYYNQYYQYHLYYKITKDIPGLRELGNEFKTFNTKISSKSIEFSGEQTRSIEKIVSNILPKVD
jgi:hypothetical protein